MPPRLVLVGPMGAGKTTVGQRLAQRWELPFADADLLIEQAAGRSVPTIFADDGEPAFRALEREVVAAALAEQQGVLSLGGGAVLDPATRAALTSHRVVFLRVGLDAAVERVGAGSGRPLLAGSSVRDRVGTLLAERTPVYESVATLVVDTDGRTPDQIADEITEKLEAHLS
jgi:shikimate kinase